MKKISWRLILRVIAIISWLVSIVWFIAKPSFDAIIAFLTGVAALIASFATSDTAISIPDAGSSAYRRNRQAMLQLVKRNCKDILEQKLHGLPIIEIDLEERPSLVDRGQNHLQSSTIAKHDFLSYKRGTEIVNETNSELLILGTPGSGKTIMLYQIAYHMTSQAEKDESHPIPVILNLSSWSETNLSFEDWLTTELKSNYHIASRIIFSWIKNDELLLMLDGLDEIKHRRRNDCIETINNFKQEHSMPLIICSRVDDYIVLRSRLQLQNAIILKPLSPEQIKEQFSSGGKKLNGLHRAIKSDEKLLELTSSPLLLNIMIWAFQDKSYSEIQRLSEIGDRRKIIFNQFIKQMLLHNNGAEKDHYSAEQTIVWLRWLAQKMEQTNKSEFSLEDLRVNWLPSKIWVLLYLFVSRLLAGLIFSTIYQLIYFIDIGLGPGLSMLEIGFQSYSPIEVLNPFILQLALKGLMLGFWAFEIGIDRYSVLLGTAKYGIIVALILLAIDLFRYTQTGKQNKYPSLRRSKNVSRTVKQSRLKLMTRILLYTLIGWLITRFIFHDTVAWQLIVNDQYLVTQSSGLLPSLFCGLIFGILFGTRASQRDKIENDIQTTETIRPSLLRFALGWLLGLALGIVIGLLNRFTALEYGIATALLRGISFGIIIGPVSGLLLGFSNRNLETKVFPNQGIILSLRNAFLATILFGLSGIIILWSLNPVFINTDSPTQIEIPGIPIPMLNFGIICGLIAFIWYGGLDFFQHYLLRLMLYFKRYIPWNYMRFLDNITNKGFLYRKGGNYIFYHPLLMEHFAKLDEDHIISLIKNN